MATDLAALDALQERIQEAPKQLIAARIKRSRREPLTEAGDPAEPMTHDQLGGMIGGVSRQHLIKLEKGVHRPRAAMLMRIAEATGRPTDWFVDPEVDPSPFPVEEG